MGSAGVGIGGNQPVAIDLGPHSLANAASERIRSVLSSAVTSTCREGLRGHHLQVAQTVYRAELLNRYQRLLSWSSGHGEGWAPYAERLMDDRGYLSDPADKLGMLDGQAMRAARVIVDIGMHLEVATPCGNPFGFQTGERWTPQLGWEFMRARCRVPDESLRFELNRYLGARPGALVQGGRAQLAAGARRDQGAQGFRLRPQEVPRRCAQPGLAWPRPATPGAGSAAYLSRKSSVTAAKSGESAML
jgi:hypothetical protein